ncbi:hypothetical protein [Vibrio aestuarianus]|uniref:Inner membrane protein n=2 Tax=Vibrio aestuarianus TaxID=28171 RepID=A0ABM9FS95_9VIBR|nr:hypothetical protein [Vibrio aestuarianus]MDE1213328.1 hypothetical protein [Vibrio aestuarianus]MDE1217592.1 hypothetical protein [Vibrio aestuarianus]MDE1257331.1 hypothetical protein [Vibrio aestuarianus]MDE1260493.1 hypothetical protein [Vibrio aestuarianus]MDE1267245.1 hypothetical protein [Vibrio aestuarianus]
MNTYDIARFFGLSIDNAETLLLVVLAISGAFVARFSFLIFKSNSNHWVTWLNLPAQLFTGYFLVSHLGWLWGIVGLITPMFILPMLVSWKTMIYSWVSFLLYPSIALMLFCAYVLA